MSENWTETSEIWGGRFAWEETPDGVRITAYEGNAASVSIPPAIGGHPVRIIGRHAFYDSGLSVTEIHVPDSVRVIEDEAFEFAVCLTELDLGRGVRTLGADFLSATQVHALRIPPSVQEIRDAGAIHAVLSLAPGNPYLHTDGYGLYNQTVLIVVHPEDRRENYRIEDGCTGIAKHALLHATGLRTLELPPSLEAAEEGAFYVDHGDEDPAGPAGTDRLQVRPDPESKGLFLSGGDLCEAMMAGRKILYCNDPDSSAVRSADRDCTHPLVRIAADAFRDSGLIEVCLPLSLPGGIGENAFAGCPLHTAVLEEQAGETRIRFPYEHGYLMTELLQGFGLDGRRYDFRFYDAAILEGAWIPEKVRMAAARLDSGKHLTADAEAAIRQKLTSRIGEVTNAVIEARDGTCLMKLCEEGIYDGQSLNDAINRAENAGATELLPILMNARTRLYGEDSFDFTL